MVCYSIPPGSRLGWTLIYNYARSLEARLGIPALGNRICLLQHSGGTASAATSLVLTWFHDILKLLSSFSRFQSAAHVLAMGGERVGRTV